MSSSEYTSSSESENTFSDKETDSEKYESSQEQLSSPPPEDNTPTCIYCWKSLLSVPHDCIGSKICINKNCVIQKDCKCLWHKQINEFYR